MAPHEVEVAARWRARDGDGEVLPVGEATPPHGETLGHACAYAGAMGPLTALLATGARADIARRRGCLSGYTALHSAVAAGQMQAATALLDAGARPSAFSASRRTPLWTACLCGDLPMALLLVSRGADPYATAAGTESPMDLLRRIGRTEMHVALTAAAGAQASAAEAAGDDSDDDDTEEQPHAVNPDEVAAARALACASGGELLLLTSLHPHPLTLAPRNRQCVVRGTTCATCPTAYVCTCAGCGYVCCAPCFDGARREAGARGGLGGADALAELLYRLGEEAVAEADPAGDAGPDDTGDALVDDGEDESDTLLTRFEAAKRADASWSKGLRRRQEDDESDEGDESDGEY
eukprot:scaffold14323_cov101-Isochrysis_galbana.AAC.1